MEETKDKLLRTSSDLQAANFELKATSFRLQSVSDELSAEKRSSEELRARLDEMETRVTEVEWELEVSKSREVEVKGQLANSSQAAVAEYKASDDFTMAWMDKVLPYYDQGKFHVLRMAAASGIPPVQLFNWGEAAHYSEIPVSMHHLIPFTGEELDTLRQREPTWSPPPVLAHNIPYLLEVARTEGIVEMTPDGWRVEPAVASDDEDAVISEKDPPPADA